MALEASVSLYALRQLGITFTITKFDDDLNVEGSYTVTPTTCTCPAGPRPSCRHRKMLPRMLAHANDGWFYNYETQKWHRPIGEEIETGSATDPSLADAVGSEHHSASYGRNPMMDELPAIKAENESRLEELRQREAALAKPAPAVQGIRRRV